MGAKALADMASPTLLRAKLDRLEILNVVRVEEQVANGCSAFVDLVGMACEDDALSDNPRRVGRHHCAAADQSQRFGMQEKSRRIGAEGDWQIAAAHTDGRRSARSKEALELMHVVDTFAAARLRMLRIEGVHEKSTRTKKQDCRVLLYPSALIAYISSKEQTYFRLDVVFKLGVSLNRKVHDRVFVLVLVQRK